MRNAPDKDVLRVLVVDDEATIRNVLRNALEKHGCEVHLAGSAEEALSLVADIEPAVALLDIVLPGRSGMRLLADLKLRWPDCEVLMITGYSSIETTVGAIRQGACDYLPKPFRNLEEVWTAVQGALDRRQAVVTSRSLVRSRDLRAREISATIDDLIPPPQRSAGGGQGASDSEEAGDRRNPGAGDEPAGGRK